MKAGLHADSSKPGENEKLVMQDREGRVMSLSRWEGWDLVYKLGGAGLDQEHGDSILAQKKGREFGNKYGGRAVVRMGVCGGFLQFFPLIHGIDNKVISGDEEARVVLDV